MNEKKKYPRTPHLPWSEGVASDDIRITSLAHLVNKDVVVTEKMDGENTTIYTGGVYHARSMDSVYHKSRSRVASLATKLSHDIPDGWRICGENLLAVHSIYYSCLPDYFLVFSIFDENNVCLSWKDTVDWCEMLGLKHVPVLYKGPWDEAKVKACFKGRSSCGISQEGYVVRNAESFSYEKFSQNLAKMVRANHVQTSQHWMQAELKQNDLGRMRT